MNNDNKIRIYNRLFFKLYLNYAVMLVITAALIGFIFMWQFQKTTMGNMEKDLEKQAIAVSNEATNDIINGKTDTYREYIDTIEKVNGWDAYSFSDPYSENPMDRNMESGDSYDEVASSKKYADMKPLIDIAFRGSRKFKWVDHDKIDQQPTLMIGYPILDDNKEVVGAIVVKKHVDELTAMINSNLYLLVISIVMSLGISFIIIIIFATELSLPISRMRGTALELSAGNYNVKTNIKRKDEIGDLAKTIDILSEKLLENDIERKNLDQMRLDFFANVSHELRTPITVVRAYTETLADGVVKDEEKVGQYYSRMLSECKSMERLVGDLLTLSKMQNPDFVIAKEPINLVQVFEDILRSAGAIAEKKKIAIELNNESPVYMILGDYDRLRQMFMVILDNAIKFSEENKTVYINLSKEDKIKVSIRDEGIGIEPSDIANIFQKFYKSSLRQNAGGTGLGLAIAKQIALKHDGTIEVDSTPGVGTKFTFTFPPFDMEENS